MYGRGLGVIDLNDPAQLANFQKQLAIKAASDPALAQILGAAHVAAVEAAAKKKRNRWLMIGGAFAATFLVVAVVTR